MRTFNLSKFNTATELMDYLAKNNHIQKEDIIAIFVTQDKFINLIYFGTKEWKEVK